MTTNPNVILSRAAAGYQSPQTSDELLKVETVKDRKLSFVESILKKQTELGDLKAASNKAFIDREWHNPLGGEVRCEIKNLISRIDVLVDKEAEIVAHLRNPAIESGLQLDFDAHNDLIESFNLLKQLSDEAQVNIENNIWLSNLDWSSCYKEVDILESKILKVNNQLRSANNEVIKKFDAKE